MKLLRFGVISLVLLVTFGSFSPRSNGHAQSNAEIKWEAPRNISNSPDKTSTDPFLIPDPSGKVHLFWGEKMGAVEGNQPDTVMYSVWDGVTWRRPVDLFFSPDTGGTPIVAYPHGVIDDQGKIHIFWMAQPNFPNYTLYYSNAPADSAYIANRWTTETRLVDDLTGTKYSIDVKYRSPGEIHVIFARVQQGASPPEERAISYIKSKDYGKTWSDPVDIFTFSSVEHGGSDTRLILDQKQGIFTTWTEWDGTGNGLRVWFCRSLDDGVTWDEPIILSERMGNEYERDWASPTLLADDQLVVMWEGGWRAYRHAQYSGDAGATWSKPVDTFPWLIGENGFVEFARDSNGTLHAFLSQRMREGYSYYGDTDSSALWHSIWVGNRRWSEPVLANGFNPMLNPKVVIYNGNRVLAVWYTTPTLEIMTMQGTIVGAPAINNQSPLLASFDGDSTVTIDDATPTIQSEQMNQQLYPTETTGITPIIPSPNTPAISGLLWVVGGIALMSIIFFVGLLWIKNSNIN